jgi:hypothetical protein
MLDLVVVTWLGTGLDRVCQGRNLKVYSFVSCMSEIDDGGYRFAGQTKPARQRNTVEVIFTE